METFRINIENLSPILQESIKNIIKTEGYKTCDVVVSGVNTEGGNFVGELYEIDITGETDDGAKEINIFTKQKKDFVNVTIVSPTFLYRRECFFYKELSEIFTALQDEANIPVSERFKVAKAYSQSSSDVIFLENLSKKGFATYDRMEGLPLKCLELAIEQIAKLHGLSFVIQNKMPKYHENNVKTLDNPLYYDENYEGLMRRVFATVAEISGDKNKAKVENFLAIYLEKFQQMRTDKTGICTLSHGDFKSTNILIRQEKGEPTEAVLVDYQYLDYGCPLRDLTFILTSNTTQEVRRNHMGDLKELYFGTLSSYLKYFGMDVEAVFPREKFDKMFTDWFTYGLMLTFFYFVPMYAPKTGIDFSSITLAEVPLELDEKSKDKVRKIIEDFVDWGYL